MTYPERLITSLALVLFLGFFPILSLTAHSAVSDGPPGPHANRVSPEMVETPAPVGTGDIGVNGSSSNPLDNWVWRNPLPQGNSLYSICYGEDTFVAVGEAGTILTSPDGAEWTSRASGTTIWLIGVTYGNNTFVVVALDGTILTSPDGVKWTRRNTGVRSSLNAVAYGNHTFVAVGQKNAAVVFTSPDGITWTERTPGIIPAIEGVTYGNNMFAAVGGGSIITSPDGITWTQRVGDADPGPDSITYGNETFVAVGSGVAFTSSDGISWARGHMDGYPIGGVTYGNGVFVAVGGWGHIFTSPDGRSFSDAKVSLTTNALHSVAYGNGTFVAVGERGAILAYPDEMGWMLISSGSWESFLNAVAYGKDMFVVVGDYATGGDALIFSSPDGITWTPGESGAAGGLTGIAYGKGTFVAVGYERTGSSSLILTSPDGTTWTSRTLGTTATLGRIAYGNNTFVAVSWFDNVGVILTSPDGTTWTRRSLDATPGIRDIAYGRNIFVVTAANGTILTSPDGIKWTRRNNAAPGAGSVAYGNNTFVAVGGGILTSPDGVKWTKRVSRTDATLCKVAYGGNSFVAVGSEPASPGNAGILLTSPDGVTWTRKALSQTGGLVGVTYGKGSFITVGFYGAILQSGEEPESLLLSVSKSGAGSGTVTSTPSGINCGSDCEAGFIKGKKVTLTATPAASSTFTGWSGACTGKRAACVVTMGAAKEVAAEFALKQFKITASVSGGHGTVSPATQTVNYGNTASVAFTPASGYHIASITDNKVSKSVANPYKVENVTVAHTVVVTFSSKYALTVTKAGSGRGTVTSVPAGIRCGATCAGNFTQGTKVTLTAVPQAKFAFTGWSGACSGAGTCTVTMDGAKSVTATFGAK